MLAKWNIQAAFLFFGTCTLATVAMFFGLPEVSQLSPYFIKLTIQYRNRSYAEIDQMFLDRVPARKFSTYETNAQMAARGANRTEEGSIH